MMVFLLSCVLALLMAPAHVAQPSDTPSTFRDQFKRQFSMTPTEFRQNL